MKYLFLLYAPEGPPEDPDDVEYAETYRAWAQTLAEMSEAGVLIDCAPLRPVSSATTVRVRDGRTLLTDGPAAEVREQVGGYTLVECDDLDEALRWASRIPSARTGWVEVRPVLPTRAPTP
ncbi:MAG TPA: YciI family protein [Micromonosporaceae bacterium]